MNWRHAAKLATLAGTLAVSSLAAAACPPVSIAVDPSVRGRWPWLPDRLRATLESRGDIDGCASVALAATRTTIAVTVELPDGRRASRSLARWQDVVPTVEALLVVPDDPPAEDHVPEDGPPASAAAAAPVARPAASSDHQPAAAAAAPAVRATPAPARTEGGLGIELSLATGARFGDGQRSYVLAAMSFVEIHRWLFGFQGRAEQYADSGSPPSTALELAALAGRRFRVGTLALDLIGGPAVAMQGIATKVVVAVDGMPGVPRIETGRANLPRLMFGARLGFRARSVLRGFVGLDGEIGGGNGPEEPRLHLPRLPAWTVGLTLGATVGTP